MKSRLFVGLVIASLTCTAGRVAHAEPPFWGTIFIDPDIITSSDPTTFSGVVYTGQGLRTVYDRRANNWIQMNAYLFQATFGDGLTAEVQVNPEFGSSAAAQVQAIKYADSIGRLPTGLRTDINAIWIHLGTQPFGGGNNSILIHTGQAALYEADGILEETFVHEASHTSLDADHAATPGWLAAQAADNEFISIYARDNPTREDVAESFLTYLAVRHRANRIPASMANTIQQTISHRIDYFDSINVNMYPIITPPPGDFDSDGDVDGADFVAWQTNFPKPTGATRGQGDADGDGDVDGADFVVWQTHFPTAPGTASVPVPEPAALALILLCASVVAGGKFIAGRVTTHCRD